MPIRWRFSARSVANASRGESVADDAPAGTATSASPITKGVTRANISASVNRPCKQFATGKQGFWERYAGARGGSGGQSRADRSRVACGRARVVRPQPGRLEVDAQRRGRPVDRLRTTRRLRAVRRGRARPAPRPAEREVPLGEGPGGLPRPPRRVHRRRRRGGAPPEAVGLLPLPALDAPHLRRRGRQGVRDPHGRRAQRGQEAPLPGERARRETRGGESGRDRHSARGVRRLEPRLHTGARDLAPVTSEPDRDAELRAVTIGELEPLAGSIELAEYDASWPELFEREAERIRSALGDRALRMEHTGSTSVPGLIAKPIIDIVLVVTDSADEAAYVADLKVCGFLLHHREPNWHEHRMLKAREPFRRRCCSVKPRGLKRRGD